MRVIRRAILLGAALVLMLVSLVACHSSTASNSDCPTTVSPTHRRAPFTLYTLCGIQYANIDGQLWQDFHPPSDGIVGTPKGWSVAQRGTLIYVDNATVKFESSAGSAVFRRINLPPRGCV
jgi:hypothetical protein